MGGADSFTDPPDRPGQGRVGMLNVHPVRSRIKANRFARNSAQAAEVESRGDSQPLKKKPIVPVASPLGAPAPAATPATPETGTVAERLARAKAKGRGAVASAAGDSFAVKTLLGA
jgi:hypothetical protein